MQTEPDVLTDHTELICSTNIERIVTGSDAALKQIGTLIENLNGISGDSRGNSCSDFLCLRYRTKQACE